MSQIPKKLGRFEVESELGRGAMGVVYKGIDPKIQRPVALKTLIFDQLAASEDAIQAKERFLVEARATGQLGHPNILTIYDAGEEGNIAYIAMEYLEGGDLQDKIEAGNWKNYDEIFDIARQIAIGLDHAHSKNIVHRDIKPANIMMMNGKVPKIADFGLARLQDSSLTTTGTVLGTPSYMAPEQVRGRKLDGRADLFALGVILYEMLTGEKAFRGESITSVIYSVVNEEPISPRELTSDLPKGIDEFMKKALAKNPDDRFQNGEEFADALKEVAAGKSGFISFTKSVAAAKEAGSGVGNIIGTIKKNWATPEKRPMMIVGGAAVGAVLLGIVLVIAFATGSEPKLESAKSEQSQSKSAKSATPAAPTPQQVAETEKKKAEEQAKKEQEEKETREAKAALLEEEKKAKQEKKATQKKVSKTVLFSADSIPSGASVFVNDKLVGKTPYLNRKYQRKKVKLTIAKVGHFDWSDTIDLNLKRDQYIKVKLAPGKSASLVAEEAALEKIVQERRAKEQAAQQAAAAAQPTGGKAQGVLESIFNPDRTQNVGRLILMADDGDEVTIDGRPYTGGIITLKDIPTGNHTIFVRRPGAKKPFLKTIQVNKGSTTTVTPVF